MPGTCKPSDRTPFNATNYPSKSAGNPNGYTCNESICAFPCDPAKGLCNTISVWDSKLVKYDFAPVIGYKEGNTGVIVSTACKGSCGTEVPNPMDVVIMADRTASMEYDDRASMKTAILESLKTMNPAMHYAAFGALHKSRDSNWTTKTNTYGPQKDDFLVTGGGICTYDCATTRHV